MVGGALLLLIIIVSSVSKNSEVKKSFEESKKQAGQNLEKPAEQNLFTKDQALKKVQDYKLQIELKSPTIPKGTTLFEVYEIRGKIPAIKNLGWSVTKSDSGKYIVSHKEETDLGINEPKWEVDGQGIRAVNGAASKNTPELGKQPKELQGSDFEKQVYNTFSTLAKKYTDEVFVKYPDPSREQMDNAEQKALSETANKYKITIEQVVEIFSRLDKAKYSL